MPLIDWTDTLSVGISSIDDQHKKLIGLINKLNEAMKAGKAREIMAGVLKEVIDYTVYHFSTEEKYMAQVDYLATVAHVNEHRQFAKKALDLQRDFTAGKTMITLEVMNFLKDWVSKHIQGTDKKYSAAFIAKGIK